jgi:adenine-specific DNA methylase
MTKPAVETADASTASTPRGRRLIEEWLPIAEIGIEALRERTPMTPFPAPNRLHVWWARRPLVASRAAILGSLLPADADHERFLHVLGIHGDPVEAKDALASARRTGARVDNPYTYKRAFSYTPSPAELESVLGVGAEPGAAPIVLDLTAGGGSIPFEAARLGCHVLANDLNPVAWVILKATVEFPARWGRQLLNRYEKLAEIWNERMRTRVRGFYAENVDPTRTDATYLWARTITCPYCGGLVPLSPNWKLNNKGLGVRLVPRVAAGGPRRCGFEIVDKATEQSAGTVKGGDGLCPYPDCGRIFKHTEIQAQAQAGQMGEQLYTVVYTQRKKVGQTKAGKPKYKKVRGFRAPRPEDEAGENVAAFLAAKLPEWEARGIVPTEQIPFGHKTGDDTGKGTDKPLKVGQKLWRDMFSPRQLLGHCTAVEVFHELVEECGGAGRVSELDAAALTYVAVAIDKIIDYNSYFARFEIAKQRMANTFSRHDFAFKWSFAEMAPCVTGLGYDWVTTAVGKALDELIDLTHPHGGDEDERGLFNQQGDGAATPATERPASRPDITITCRSGNDLPHLADASVDAVVVDPPYGANVMYAELADFFYVWLKRTAGLLFPEPFSNHLTDKDREAVANPAKFKDFSKVRGSGGAARRANRDYQERMQGIFAEARRVLKPDGIMTLMFTHKASGAWDALAKGLVDAGFVITASWPIQTEAEGSLHIKDKNAAKSTIFLVCRPRAEALEGAAATYWEDVEPLVREVVERRVAEFQAAGIGGVDLYLACFGPALEVFSRHWPMTRGRAAQRPPVAKGATLKLIEDEEFDPYAVSPEDALMAARGAVKRWRIAQIATLQRKGHLDELTEWFVLAWDAFRSPQFPADEALKLARVVGVNFDEKLRGRILEVKGNDVVLWDSGTRARKGAIGSATGGVMLDAIHQAANLGRELNTGAAADLIERAELKEDGGWLLALQAVLEVLPTPRMLSSTAPAPMSGAAADSEALEKLRLLAYATAVPKSKQWLLFETE